MGPFPFIRFEQAEINGNFGDEHAYRKMQLQTLVSLFVDDYFLGDKFFVSVNEIRNEVELLNQAPTFASLELVLPSPYPTSVGVEVYTLEITIQQQTDYLPSFIAITFDLTDGIVTSSTTVFTTGLTKEDSATNRPFIDEELKLARTLSVYNQNGAAIFPDTFTYNPTTGIAERRLLRAYDWEYNTTTNRPQRDGVTDLRMIPKTVFRLRELTQIEKAMVSFFLEKPIKESLTNDNWNASNIYLIPLLGDWQFDFITVSSSKKQLSISSSEYGISLILAGIKVSSKWYFQRFVDPDYTSGTPPNLASALSGTTPANPDYGKLYSTDYYYDFDQCEFGTVVNEEPFNLTIKSADAYQINIATDFIFDPAIDPESDEAPKIGIFDCNGKYLQDIGKIGFPPVVFPDCIETFTTKIFFPAPDNATKYWNWPTVQFVSIPGLAFLKMYLVDSNLNETFEAEFSMEFGSGADLDTFDVAVFCTQLQALITGLGYTCVVTYVEGDEPPPQIEPQITVEITADLCNTVAINFVFTYTFVGTLYTYNVGLYTPIVLPEQPVLPTQYQASLTIPPLANGIYRIGIYNTYFIEDVNHITLFAMSQPLQVDNFETFTQILEYGSAQNSIIEGFEYLNGWIQRIRVALNGAGQTYALEESIYRNSDGTFQKPQNSTDEIIYLHTDYFDLKTQRAMTSATRHPIFVLANQNLSVQGDLEIATNQDYTTNQSFRKLQQMRFQAKNQGYQPNNNSCLG
jgi:hypothetical protein